MSEQLERCEREWHELEGEFQELQETHRVYKQKLEELTALQTSCSGSISKQKKRLRELKHTLQSLYLNLVLGNVNVTLLSNQAKFAYKDEYEKFKLYLTIILLLGAVACRFFLHYSPVLPTSIREIRIKQPLGRPSPVVVTEEPPRHSHTRDCSAAAPREQALSTRSQTQRPQSE